MDYLTFEAMLKSRGISVYQLAKATGISTSTLSDWKNGRSTPKADKLARIADYFEDALFSEIDCDAVSEENN